MRGGKGGRHSYQGNGGEPGKKQENGGINEKRKVEEGNGKGRAATKEMRGRELYENSTSARIQLGEEVKEIGRVLGKKEN